MGIASVLAENERLRRELAAREAAVAERDVAIAERDAQIAALKASAVKIPRSEGIAEVCARASTATPPASEVKMCEPSAAITSSPARQCTQIAT